MTGMPIKYQLQAVIREDGTVEETSSYYPYGGFMGSGSMGVHPYKFGGKELDRIGGINHYDFNARQLQLPIPHFYQQDPYADKYPHLSPYLYCAANPLRYVDPGGCEFNIIDFKVQETIKNTLSKEDAICLIKDKLAILVLSCKNYG